jgi:hypothetical protein
MHSGYSFLRPADKFEPRCSTYSFGGPCLVAGRFRRNEPGSEKETNDGLDVSRC